MKTSEKSGKRIGSAILFIFALFVNYGNLAAKDLNEHHYHKFEKTKKPNIVFLVTKDTNNYEAHKTVPVFAKMLKENYGYDVTVLLGSGKHGSYRYPDMGKVSKADLLVIFARRIALPHKQMNIIKNHLKKGKPLIGIRTANHAFTVRDKIEDGFEDWPEFVADILGCENRGYGPVGPGTEISVSMEEERHPILKDVDQGWHVEGNVYLVAPLLDKTATVLLEGRSDTITEPVAWTRTAGKSKVFYTSLGYPTDFLNDQFKKLLGNAIIWTLE